VIAVYERKGLLPYLGTEGWYVPQRVKDIGSAERLGKEERQ